ncbi:MAG: FAD-dependent oxidoreductase [Gammaproteobacteria bacterium]|nr:FAD-dependent oxidoreductase [Gammaproteobacteria bacterium]
MSMNRRQFVQVAGSAALLPLVGVSLTGCTETRSGPARVAVIGGGFGGATVATYLKKYDPKLDVTLIEPKTSYMTCPGSNWYLAGLRDAKSITHNYEGLKKRGIKVVHDTVTSVDTDANTIKLASGTSLSYDKVVVSPGIDFKWGAVEGITEANADKCPHAWQAGAQTELLKKQIEGMKQGGTFVMVAPPNPFRCPPGPYERVGMVAEYFKKHNPKAKILILDAKDAFSKQGLFLAAWQDVYPGMIEWVSAKDGGKVTKVDAASMTVYSEYGNIKADVINAIPAQKAAALASKMGLTNESGFCPVDMLTFESKLKKNVYVVGDASIAGAMPKSGHSASSQGKICAAAIVNDLAGLPTEPAQHVNTCYSLVAGNYGISVAGVYSLQDGKIAEIKGSGGVSPKDAKPEFRQMEATYALGWYASITKDVWGTGA